MSRFRQGLILGLFLTTIAIQGICYLFGNEVDLNAVTYDLYLDNSASYIDIGLEKELSKRFILHKTADSNSDLIVTLDSNYKYNKDAYTKLNIGHSPIVAYFPNAYLHSSYENKDFAVQRVGNSYWYSTDIKKILQAILKSENGEIDLKQLGFNDNKHKDPVALGIPSVSFEYRKDVIIAIMYILNDGKDILSLTEDSLIQLVSDTNEIVGKSKNIENVLNLISNNEEDIILLAPEYLISTTRNYVLPVYWKNQYALDCSMLYKNTLLKKDEASSDGSNNKDNTTKFDFKYFIKEFNNSILEYNFTRNYIRNNSIVQNNGNTSRYANKVSMRFLENDFFDKIEIGNEVEIKGTNNLAGYKNQPSTDKPVEPVEPTKNEGVT